MTRQIEEQEEIAKLQKKLTQHQLRQFEEQEKADTEMNVYRSPTNIGMRAGMTTRSITHGANMQRNIANANLVTNTGLGPIQRGNIVGTGVPVVRNPMHLTQHSSNESLDLYNRATPSPRFSPFSSNSSLNTVPTVAGGLSTRSGSTQSLAGSTDSLNRRHRSFARGLQAHYPDMINLSDDMELRHRGPAIIQPTLQEQFTAPNRYSTPKIPKRKTSPPPMPSSGLYEIPVDTTLGGARPPNIPSVRHSAAFFKTFKDFPKRIRSIFPARGSPVTLGENVPLLTDVPGGRIPRRMTSLGRFLNTHKRKLIVGGGVIAGVAIVGGILSDSAKRQKTMQGNAESRGMFEQLSTGSISRVGVGSGGGGGGGGFGRYQQVQSAARRPGVKKRASKKGGGGGGKKPRGGKKQVYKKKAVRNGGVKKRRSPKAVCSINKRGKKVCRKRKPKTAF